MNLEKFIPVKTMINGREDTITISRDIIGQLLPKTKYTYTIILKASESIPNQTGDIIYDSQYYLAYDEQEDDE